MKKLLSAVLFLLAGCQAEIKIPVDLKDFDLNEGAVRLAGQMTMELPRCTAPDSDTPDETLLQLQEKIIYVFEGAEYLDCTEQDYGSVARFSIPAWIDNVRDKQPASNKVLNLTFFPDKDGKRYLVISAPEKLQARIGQLEDVSPLIEKENLSLTLQISNSGKPLEFIGVGVYLNGEPVQWASYRSGEGNVDITIPTYGLEYMMKDAGKGFTAMYGARVGGEEDIQSER